MSFEPGPANPRPFSHGLPSQPALDVLAMLPARAADRLRALRQRVDDLHSLVPPFEQRREASDAKIEAENRLTRLQAHSSAGGFSLKGDDERVLAARQQVETLTADFDRLQRLDDERSASWRAAGYVLRATEDWLRDGLSSSTVLVDFDVEVPKPAKGETVLDAVERHRRRVRELRADLHRIRSAPMPSSYCKAQMREMVEQLAQQGAPNVSALVEHGRKIEFATMRVQSEVLNAQPGAVGFAQVPDVIGLFAFVHKSTLIAALDAEIDREADDGAALTHEQRQKAEAVVLGDLLEAERLEAALTWRAMSEGQPVEHRSDIDPRAILQVRVAQAPSAVNGSTGTSRGMSWLRR